MAGNMYGPGSALSAHAALNPYAAMPTPAPPTEREILQDLLARASSNARRLNTYNQVPISIRDHQEAVKNLLEEFLEASSYLQAQIPMVEAAFKDRPELSRRVVGCIEEAYSKLCSETFGKE